MTKSELEKVRNEKAKSKFPYQPVRQASAEAYKIGWDEATSLLWPIIERQREALEWYADGLYPGDESEVTPGVFRTGKRARQALELPATVMSSVSETATKKDEKGAE